MIAVPHPLASIPCCLPLSPPFPFLCCFLTWFPSSPSADPLPHVLLLSSLLVVCITLVFFLQTSYFIIMRYAELWSKAIETEAGRHPSTYVSAKPTVTSLSGLSLFCIQEDKPFILASCFAAWVLPLPSFYLYCLGL